MTNNPHGEGKELCTHHFDQNANQWRYICRDCNSAVIGRIAEFESQIKTCGTHPGMSCPEVHLDNQMKINKLESEITSLSDLKERLFGDVAELESQIKKLENANRDLEKQIAGLMSGLNLDVYYGKVRDLESLLEKRTKALEEIASGQIFKTRYNREPMDELDMIQVAKEALGQGE